MKFLAVLSGGAVGALLRYAVSGLSYSLLGSDFPWGTFTVNLLGSFLIGFLGFWLNESISDPHLRTLVLVGGLGAFTTFSTYALDAVNLFQEGATERALLYIVGSNLAGVSAVFLGLLLGRMVLEA